MFSFFLKLCNNTNSTTLIIYTPWNDELYDDLEWTESLTDTYLKAMPL
jgi:hypothetical protein